MIPLPGSIAHGNRLLELEREPMRTRRASVVRLFPGRWIMASSTNLTYRPMETAKYTLTRRAVKCLIHLPDPRRIWKPAGPP